MTSTLLRLSPAVALVWCATAEAADPQAAKAEHVRLSEEMRKLAAKNTWRGVDASYLKMLDLEKSGVVLAYEDHFLGAQAARELGRITDVYDRLLRARARKADEACVNWIAEIEGVYARVDLSKDDRYTGEAALSPAEMPFEGDQRNAIGAAQLALTNTGEYAGLLPFGTYTFGDKTFEVKAGGQVVKVYLAPAGASGRTATEKRRDGLRISLGPQWAQAGEPSQTATGSGVSPTSFGGIGLRGGLGWEIQLANKLGLMAEAGYHGMLPRADKDDSGVVPESLGEVKARLNAFYVWGGATFFHEDFAVSAGPSWWVGGGTALGVAANGVPTAVDAERMMAGGGTLSVFYGLFDTPGLSRSRSGVSLCVGAHSDLNQLYPWAQLAFTVSPSI
jgi:hypothetical protein